jgi:glucoamylase
VSETLEAWIEREYRHAGPAMLRAISATGIVKARPFFGQTITPQKGSSIASPELAAYDPDPDYFFHWYRDSAIVLDAHRILFDDGAVGPEAVHQFADFVRFSLALRELDGHRLVHDPRWREKVWPDHQKFIRADADLARAHGEEILGETRVNPDGTLDISSWPRPQNDGPALRALSVLRWLACVPDLDEDVRRDAAALLRGDLAFTSARWSLTSFDIWEEEEGHHYYTLRVQAAALADGADWLEQQGEAGLADEYRQKAATILERLDAFWLPDEGFYRSRILPAGPRSTRERDIAVILAAIHSRGRGATHSVRDPRMQATLAMLERTFDESYPINHGQRAGPAMGRYPGDVYYSGGAWYVSTLGAAEFCFRAAAAGAGDSSALVRHGDAFLETVRQFTPPSGDLSEQFDKATGAQTSAKNLAWSYAALISCREARKLAMALVEPPLSAD